MALVFELGGGAERELNQVGKEKFDFGKFRLGEGSACGG